MTDFHHSMSLNFCSSIRSSRPALPSSAASPLPRGRKRRLSARRRHHKPCAATQTDVPEAVGGLHWLEELALCGQPGTAVAPSRRRQPRTAPHGVALGAATYVDPRLLALQAHLEVGPLDVDNEVLALDVLGQRQQDRHVRQVLRPSVGRAAGHRLDGAAAAYALRPGAVRGKVAFASVSRQLPGGTAELGGVGPQPLLGVTPALAAPAVSAASAMVLNCGLNRTASLRAGQPAGSDGSHALVSPLSRIPACALRASWSSGGRQRGSGAAGQRGSGPGRGGRSSSSSSAPEPSRKFSDPMTSSRVRPGVPPVRSRLPAARAGLRGLVRWLHGQTSTPTARQPRRVVGGVAAIQCVALG